MVWRKARCSSNSKVLSKRNNMGVVSYIWVWSAVNGDSFNTEKRLYHNARPHTHLDPRIGICLCSYYTHTILTE